MTPYLVLLLTVLVIATGLLAWIARLLYTLRAHTPSPERLPSPQHAAVAPLPAPTVLAASAPATEERTPPPTPVPAPRPTPTPPTPPPAEAAPGPLFYEYTDGGLVPVDPHAPAARPAAEDTAGGDSDPRVSAEEIEPEEEGFVWL